MSIDVLHLLKASNVPLIMFDRSISSVKSHKGNLSSNGSKGLLKRNNFNNNMNEKVYHNTSMMKPKVCETHLSSGRSNNVVNFSFKEMILNGDQ